MKDIKGYEGLYAVTSCGKVWSHKRQKFISVRSDKDGYLRVTLSKNGEMKTHQLHRLVAEAYIPNPLGLPEINHKDEDKTHDWVNNLEWCSHAYNVNYGTRNERAAIARRNSDSEGARKGVYCIELDEAFSSMTIASLMTGVAQADISKNCNGKRKSAGRHPKTGERLHWTTDYNFA